MEYVEVFKALTDMVTEGVVRGETLQREGESGRQDPPWHMVLFIRAGVGPC